MNEQITLLAAQASDDGDHIHYYNLAFAEKFAELIVAECAQVCRDQPNHYALKADRDNCAVAIEEHFGVEE